MAMSSLRSMVRMATRAGTTFSSSAAPGTIYGSRSALFNVHGRSLLSDFLGSRGIHSRAQPRRRRPSASVTVFRRVSLPARPKQQAASRRGARARRLHVFAALTVAASSALAGVWYWMEKSDKQPPALIVVTDEVEDPAMETETDAYLRRVQLEEDLQRAMAYYNKAMVEEEEEDDDDDDDDPAMRARFADWMEEHGRTYRDEEEKARRFRIFRACARYVDAANAHAEAAESGASVIYGLSEFADWNALDVAINYYSEWL